MVTPEQPSRRLLAPGDKLGKHEVLRQIASGGIAELYLTRTVGVEGLEKLVCVKRIVAHGTDGMRFADMVLGEARLAAMLHHPNIAQVYDVGQESGDHFFSMEYVHGEDLGRLVAASREHGVPISLDCALTIAAGLCAGLHYAHDKTADGKPLGLVHRDVSPSNVLVSYDGAVKLVDFGLARAAGDLLSPQAGRKNKISYMSPEQIQRQGALDRRSDVFSIGTILYELTTGRAPFVDHAEAGILRQIVERDADPPSVLLPGYPPVLEAIVMQALARDPDRRFSTALALQNQIEDFAHDHRLRVSPLVLARLMSTLFPARLEEWDHARAQGAFFVEQHVVRTLIESGKTTDSAPRMTPPVVAVDAGWAIDPQVDAVPEAVVAEPTQPEPVPMPALGSAPAPQQPSHPRPGAATLPPRPGAGSPSSPPIGRRVASATLPPAVPRSGPPSTVVQPSQVKLPALPGVPPSAGARAPAKQPGAASPAPMVPLRAASPAGTPAGGRRAAASGSGLPSLQLAAPASSSVAVVPPSTSPGLRAETALTSSMAESPSAPSGSPNTRSLHPAPVASSAVSHAPLLQPPSTQAAASPWSSPLAPLQSLPLPHRAAVQAPTSAPSPAMENPGRSPVTLANAQLAAAWGGSPAASVAASQPRPAPIGMLSAPPIPSGGTLVSSATLAGRVPPTVKPVQGPNGATGGLEGLAGQSGHHLTGAPSGLGAPGGPAHGLPMETLTGPGSHAPALRRHPQRGDATEQVRAVARPSVMNAPGARSRRPLIVVAAMSLLGAAVGVWLVVGSGSDRIEPEAAAPVPGATNPRTPEGTAREAPPPAATAATPSAPTTDARLPTTDAPPPGSAAGHAMQPPAKPAAASSQPARPAGVANGKPELAKKKPAPSAPQESRAKAKRVRPEAKRTSKDQPKEQSWNDDSPFMPVATPKR